MLLLLTHNMITSMVLLAPSMVLLAPSMVLLAPSMVLLAPSMIILHVMIASHILIVNIVV
jgi:hypothetical protein